MEGGGGLYAFAGKAEEELEEGAVFVDIAARVAKMAGMETATMVNVRTRGLER